MKNPTKFTELSAEIKAHARDHFVGNECGSDEYRETQPEKGLGYFMSAHALLEADLKKITTDERHDRTLLGLLTYSPTPPTLTPEETDRLARRAPVVERMDKLMKLCVTWVQTAPNANAYDGNAEAEPLMAECFDILWEHDEHPYGHTVRELLEFMQDVGFDDPSLPVFPEFDPPLQCEPRGPARPSE